MWLTFRRRLLLGRRRLGTVQEQDRIGHNLRPISLLPVRPVPGTRPQATLYVGPTPLLEKLAARLCQLIPGYHAKPLCFFPALAVRRGVIPRGGDAKSGDG